MSFKQITAWIKGQTPDGSDEYLQLDTSKNLLVSLNTLIAGEDITNDVLKVENRFSLTNIATSAGTTVKTGSGYINKIQINNAGTAWEVDVYDGTASTGTSLAKIRSAAASATFEFEGTFSTGLFIDTVKGSTVGDLTVSYR